MASCSQKKSCVYLFLAWLLLLSTMSIKFVILFLVSTHSVFSQQFLEQLYCPFQPLKLGNNETDPFHIDIIPVGESIEIPCCQRYETLRLQKVWYKRNRFFTDNEVKLRMPFHALELHLLDVQEHDAGIYYCKDLGVPGYVNTYFYILDVEYENATTIHGDFDTYESYVENHINKINSYLNQPDNAEIIAFHNHTGITLQAVIRWEPWTPCDYCKGEKVRKGRCHLQPQLFHADPSDFQTQVYKYALQMDCQSHWTIRKILPQLAERVKDVPHFEGVIKCVGPCSKDILAGFDYVKKLRTRLLLVGRTAVLGCPGHTRLNTCYWRRDGIKLTSDDYDPTRKVSVNEFCLLYLVDVTTAEAGNYTCYVDDKMVQQNKVIVDEFYQEKKASLLRHIMYLLYIIFICFVILVGGIVINYFQRHNFKKIKEEEIIEMYAGRRFEHERLLPPIMNISKDE